MYFGERKVKKSLGDLFNLRRFASAISNNSSTASVNGSNERLDTGSITEKKPPSRFVARGPAVPKKDDEDDSDDNEFTDGKKSSDSMTLAEFFATAPPAQFAVGTLPKGKSKQPLLKVEPEKRYSLPPIGYPEDFKKPFSPTASIESNMDPHLLDLLTLAPVNFTTSDLDITSPAANTNPPLSITASNSPPSITASNSPPSSRPVLVDQSCQHILVMTDSQDQTDPAEELQSIHVEIQTEIVDGIHQFSQHDNIALLHQESQSESVDLIHTETQSELAELVHCHMQSELAEVVHREVQSEVFDAINQINQTEGVVQLDKSTEARPDIRDIDGKADDSQILHPVEIERAVQVDKSSETRDADLKSVKVDDTDVLHSANDKSPGSINDERDTGTLNLN